MIRPFRVHLICLSFDLSKLVFIVLGLNVLVTTTSANIGPSTLVLLLCQG